MNRNALSLTGLVMRSDQSYLSLCPELDVASEGDTVAEAKRMLREAVAGYLELCFESNLPYLRPVTSRNDPRLTSPQDVVSEFPVKVDLGVKVHA